MSAPVTEGLVTGAGLIGIDRFLVCAWSASLGATIATRRESGPAVPLHEKQRTERDQDEAARTRTAAG